MDGQILEEKERYDNAVHLYGFAAECALKSLMMVYCDMNAIKNKYGHSSKEILRDLYVFAANSSGASLLDPALGLKLAKMELPEVLFRSHPERRYAADGTFNKAAAERCREGACFLIREMVTQHINGYI